MSVLEYSSVVLVCNAHLRGRDAERTVLPLALALALAQALALALALALTLTLTRWSLSMRASGRMRQDRSSWPSRVAS